LVGVFRDIRHYFETGELLPPPLVPEVVANVKEQLSQSLAWKDEPKRAILEMRRHFARYFPNLKDFRDLRVELLRALEVEEVIRILDVIAAEYANERVDYTNIGLK
jgi:tRNA-dihydrouridine synthase